MVTDAEKIRVLREALQAMHDNKKEYVEINNLGRPYRDFYDMRMARDALEITAPCDSSAPGETEAFPSDVEGYGLEAWIDAVAQPAAGGEIAPGETVTPGSIWCHYNGNIYTVVILANTEGDDPTKHDKYPPTVVYQGQNGKIWAGRLDDWHRRMTPQPAAGEGGSK